MYKYVMRTFGVADNGLADVVLLQRQLCQSDPLITVRGIEVSSDQAELQSFVHVAVILIDHGQRGERLVGQWSCRKSFSFLVNPSISCLASLDHLGNIPCLMISIHITMASSLSPLA